MKRIIMWSLLTNSVFAAPGVTELANIIGHRNPRKVFNEVLERNSIIVVKCVSTHCPKCKKILDGFAALAEKYHDKALFLSINVQKFDDITDRFNLKSVPTFIIFVQGKAYKKIRGSGNLDTVARSVAELVKTLK